jgi:BirA family transcriptional regulator, biotin operon repressor / biotin---[acetyl-CoA-carboxylase] ligase
LRRRSAADACGIVPSNSPTSTILTPHTLEVLRLLEDGEFHSGEALGRVLGITRGSVSNALADVDALGLTVHKVHGRGYRLVTPVQWLAHDRIIGHLGKQAARFDIDILDQTGSTNTDMLDRAMRGARSGSVLVAESQTRGRGRRGRDWHSSPGGALTFSILWRFGQGAGFLSGLSLVVGIALARVLRKHGAAEVMLKWPNDLLWRHLKLAGILIELAGDVMGPTVAVIGIGINLRLPEAVKERIDQPVVDLARIGVEVDRNLLFAEILGGLDIALRQFSVDGFAPFRNEWDRLHAYQDKMVRVRMPDNSEMEGRVQSVGEDGALLLQTRSGLRKFYGGELSLRGTV